MRAAPRGIHVDVLDLTGRRENRLPSELRARRRQVTRGSLRRLVVDLGPRRTLPEAAVRELMLLHRALAASGGRCAVVALPAVAAQVSVASLEGVTFAARREVAAALVARACSRAAVSSHFTRRCLEIRLAGELDLAGHARVKEELARVTAFARAGREVVFDVHELSFIDAGGLRALVHAAVLSQLAGAQTRLVGVPPQMLRMLERLKWADQLTGILVPDEFERSALGWVSRAPRPTADPASAVLVALADELDDGLEALIATDLKGKVTHWNGAATRLYGWSRDEAVGRPITELTVGPRDASVAAEVMDAVRRNGTWEGEFEVRRKDGATFRAYVRDSIIAGADGRPAGVLGLSVELSARAA